MLNKNDPLIGAVQQVMQQSNAEREATRLVNEAFGVEDRKALPHEYQAEWDAVYKTVLTEGVEALDEASLPKPPTSVKAVKALGMDERRARAKAHKAEAKKHKNVYDTHYERGSHGTQTAQKALDRYIHHNDMADRYLNPSSHFQNEKNRERDFSDGGVKVYNEAKIDHPNKRKLDVAPPYGELTKKDFSTLRAMGEDLEAIQEEIAYNLAEQAEYVYENYGEEGLVEFIDSLTEDQYELLSLSEGSWSDTLKSAWDTLRDPTGLKRSAEQQIKKRDVGQQASSAIQKMNATTSQQAGTGSAGPNRGLGSTPAAPKPATPPPKPTARPADLNTSPKAKKAAPQAAAPKATAPKATAQPKKKLTFFQKQELRRSEKNDTMDQTRRLKKRYGVMEQIQGIIAEKLSEQSVLPKNLGPGSGFAGQHSVGNQTVRSKTPQEFMKQTSTFQGMQNAIKKPFDTTVKPGAPKSTISTPIMDKAVADKAKADTAARQSLSDKVRAGRVGDPGKQNFIQNARAQAQREKAAGMDGTKRLPGPDRQKAERQAALSASAAERKAMEGRPQTLSPGAVGAKAQPVAQSNPSSFKFTDAERKGKVSAERLKQWQSSQGAGSEKLGLGNFLNAAQGKSARAGNRNDMSQQQKTYNIKRSNLDRGQ